MRYQQIESVKSGQPRHKSCSLRSPVQETEDPHQVHTEKEAALNIRKWASLVVQLLRIHLTM